jgi:hypothetical protein
MSCMQRTGTPSGYTEMPSKPYVVFENWLSASCDFPFPPRPWKDKMIGTLLLISYDLGT